MGSRTSRSEDLIRDAAALALVFAGVVSTCCATQPAEPQPRHVFIDGGAHAGESYQAFRKSGLYSKHSWDIYAIEANPTLARQLPKAPHLTVLAKAIWVSPGTVEFHMESDASGSNSMFAWRPKDELTTIAVESFDFSQWVKQTFSEQDYVILSMDIEGAEYEVLEKMLHDDTAKYVDRLYVELHPWQIKGIKQKAAEKKGRRLLNDFRRRGLMVGEDSVEDVMMAGAWLDFII